MTRQGLLLNETSLSALPESKRAVFVHEWLRRLHGTLPSVARTDVFKDTQKTLVAQLMKLAEDGSPGPPARVLIAKCLTTVFTVGDTFLLFDTINKFNDLLKNRDDSPSFLPTRLAAICILGHMYETLGRMTGRSYEETVQVLMKGLKNAESQTRLETMVAFGKVCSGLGSAASNVHRDLYKQLRAALYSDRVMAVRAAAASSIVAMADSAAFLTSTELENLATSCFRGFDGANYETRKAIAKCLGTILAMTQQQSSNTREGIILRAKKKGATLPGQPKPLPLEDALAILMQGFLKGGSGSGLIKGGSPVSQEVRVGVTHCYVIMAQTLGSRWLEKNFPQLLNHVLELVTHPKAATCHVDAVYSRRCVGHIIQILLGKLLGENAQLVACKEMARTVDKLMNALDVHPENTKDSANAETVYSQHQLVVALQELGTLFLRLGTATRTLLSDTSLRLTDILVSVLLHPCQAPRLAAAFCLRSLCVAVPSHLTPSIDRCLEGLEKFKSSAEAVAGYSGAIAALLEATRHTPLGIPHTKGKFIFNVGEELLRTASQSSRLSQERTQAGWLLIGSIMTLGPTVVKGLLPRMMLLWRNAFPRSQKELDSEKARGDAFTWKISLEARAGAVASIHAFLLNSQSFTHFNEVMSDDVLRRLSVPLEACLNLCANMGPVVKAYPVELKALAAMLRLRLYEALTLLPPGLLEGSYTQLLRLLVAEFTLADGQSSTSTSLLRSLCHSDDSVILGTRFQDAEEAAIEDQLLANSASGSGALEHDLCSLFRPMPRGSIAAPGALPLGVSVVDQSIKVFGSIFPKVAQKHRLQMLQHFAEHLKQAQGGKAAKQAAAEAVQMNIFTAVLSSLKCLADAKAKFGQEDVKKAAVELILGALASPNPMLRCASGEALGRMAQVDSDSRFVADAAQNSFDRLRNLTDIVSRTGHSLALGCLHRYVGGMASAQHLRTSVPVLTSLAQDSVSPEVQVWALHALALIADSGGPMFRGFVEDALSTVLKLLLSVQATSLEVMSCLGRVLSALITTVGPELQMDGKDIDAIRESFLCACAILQSHGHPVIQAEAIASLQQLHMFAGGGSKRNQRSGWSLSSSSDAVGLELTSLVPTLCQRLRSPHLVLRQSSVACLRQLAQREAKEVCEYAANTIVEGGNGLDSLRFTESGLPGVLFSILDHEMDPTLLSHVHDTLSFIMQSMAAENLTTWLTLLREVLAVSSDSSSDPLIGSGSNHTSLLDEKDMEDYFAADDVEFTTGEDVNNKDCIQPRWHTRVFSATCLRKIIEDCCQGNRAHYDLGLAKEMQLTQSRGDFLVLHLSELVRVAFMAATSESDPLRLEGLKTLETIIAKFGETPEPEFPGHVILEQYQAQVGAALRPAFAPETPGHITAAAADVCSAWIGSGVARDLGDLRRVYQLLVASLDKMTPKNSQLYNESALTLEKLSILKAWAEVYTVSMKNEIDKFYSGKSEKSEEVNNDDEDDFGDFETMSTSSQPQQQLQKQQQESLAALVQSELPSLSKHWLAALKDHALLSLPPEFRSQMPHDGGAFYTNDTLELSRPYYRATWPPILYAAAVWLTYGQGFDDVCEERAETHVEGAANLGLGAANAGASKSPEAINGNRFFLLFGICVEALANSRSADLSRAEVTGCLKALRALLDHPWSRKEVLAKDCALLVELCNVLHRTVLTRDHPATHLLAVQVLQLVLTASKERLEQERKRRQKELELPANAEGVDTPELDLLGDGGESGRLEPQSSVVFATLEVCLCVLVRYFPDLSPRAASISSVTAMQAAKSRTFLTTGRHLSTEQGKLVALALNSLADLPSLCSPVGAITVAPSVLWLLGGVLKESTEDELVTAAALQGLKTLATCRYADDPRCSKRWAELLQSSLLRLLDLSKTSRDDDESGSKPVDQCNLLLAVAVFVLHCPPAVVCAPNVQWPAINAFTQGICSDDATVKRKAVQTLHSIFQRPERMVSVPYIHALAPRMLEFLLDETSREVKTESDLQFTFECCQAMEGLLKLLSREETEKRVQLLEFLVPVLVGQLLPQCGKDASKLRLRLHEAALVRLTAIGQAEPTEFRAVLARRQDMKARLESALLSSQAAKDKGEQHKGQQQPQRKEHTPSIKLKMDFSDFAAQ